jgi:hypothetical protein
VDVIYTLASIIDLLIIIVVLLMLGEINKNIRVISARLARMIPPLKEGDRLSLPKPVRLRADPRPTARPTTNAALGPGTVVTVLKIDGDWAWLQTDKGHEGFAPLADLVI